MINLPGVKLPELPVSDLEWVSDLEYFDGPLLSHFVHPRGDHFLRYWVDCNATVTRWMIARVNENHVIRLANRLESLDKVLPSQCQDDFVYFVDTNKKGEQAVVLIQLQSIPGEYVPGDDAPS